MSTDSPGRYHPSTRSPVITIPTDGQRPWVESANQSLLRVYDSKVSFVWSDSDSEDGTTLWVWDWKSGFLLFASFNSLRFGVTTDQIACRIHEGMTGTKTNRKNSHFSTSITYC